MWPNFAREPSLFNRKRLFDVCCDQTLQQVLGFDWDNFSLSTPCPHASLRRLLRTNMWETSIQTAARMRNACPRASLRRLLRTNMWETSVQTAARMQIACREHLFDVCREQKLAENPYKLLLECKTQQASDNQPPSPCEQCVRSKYLCIL